MPPPERMWSSAIASSSPVVTPGRTASRSTSRVSPVRRPATRIFSIWSGVLISIPRSRKPNVLALRDVVEGVEDPLRDLVDVAHAVDLDHQAAVAVDPDQRGGLVVVHLVAAAYDVLGVVGAALGRGALEQPLHELLLVDGEHHDRIEHVAGVLDHP